MAMLGETPLPGTAATTAAAAAAAAAATAAGGASASASAAAAATAATGAPGAAAAQGRHGHGHPHQPVVGRVAEADKRQVAELLQSNFVRGEMQVRAAGVWGVR